MSTRRNIRKFLKEYEEDELYSFKPNFTASDFIKWVDSELDKEVLEMVLEKVGDRLNFLNAMDYISTRKEVKGFRR